MTTDNDPQRVALRSHPELVGTAGATDKHDLVQVQLDGGGVGTFKASDLIPADEAPATNKTWPPAGLETKAAAS